MKCLSVVLFLRPTKKYTITGIFTTGTITGTTGDLYHRNWKQVGTYKTAKEIWLLSCWPIENLKTVGKCVFSYLKTFHKKGKYLYFSLSI